MSDYESFKRLKSSPAAAVNTVDRFSELPEALIIHILSFLPTRDVIKTGSLSKRWKRLWTLVPKLYLDGVDDWNWEGNYDFIDCVDRIVHKITCSKLESFSVMLEHDAKYDSQLYEWTWFATSRDVEKFKLDLFPLNTDQPFVLPSYLYTNSSFTELVFSACCFDYASRATVSWNSLKKLEIDGGYVSNKAIENILAGTPLLEILDLTTFLHTDPTLRFEHPGLKKLILMVSYLRAVTELEILAPKLESLELKGDFHMSKLVGATSLVEASLDGYNGVISGQVIYSLFNRPTLTLDACSIQCLSGPSQHDNSNIDQFWTSQDVASNYFKQLRTVKLYNFWSYRTIGLQFVQLLLRYAKVLQNMVIYLEATSRKVLGPTEISEVSQKLLTFQRCSPDAQVYVYPRPAR